MSRRPKNEDSGSASHSFRLRRKSESEETEETVDTEESVAGSSSRLSNEHPPLDKLLGDRVDSDDSPPPLEELLPEDVPFRPKVAPSFALRTSSGGLVSRVESEVALVPDEASAPDVGVSHGDQASRPNNTATETLIKLVLHQVSCQPLRTDAIVRQALLLLQQFRDSRGEYAVDVDSAKHEIEMALRVFNGAAPSTGNASSENSDERKRKATMNWVVESDPVANRSGPSSNPSSRETRPGQDLIVHDISMSGGFSNSPRAASPEQLEDQILQYDSFSTNEMKMKLTQAYSEDIPIASLCVNKNTRQLVASRRNGLAHECNGSEYTTYRLIECDDPSIRVTVTLNGDHIIGIDKRVLIRAGRENVETLTSDEDVKDIDVVGDTLYVLTSAQILLYTRGDSYLLHTSIPLARGNRMAVYNDSVIYVTQPKNYKIVKLDLATLALTTFVSGLEKPKAITLDPEGRVLVGDDHDIRVYEADGTQKCSVHVRSPIYDLQVLVRDDRRPRQEAAAPTSLQGTAESADSLVPSAERVDQFLFVLMKNQLRKYQYTP